MPACTAARSIPASTSAPRSISPLMPLMQSTYALLIAASSQEEGSNHGVESTGEQKNGKAAIATQPQSPACGRNRLVTAPLLLGGLPISHAAVLIKHALRQLLLEGMLLHFRFVDLDAQAGPGVGPHDAAAGFD